MLKKISGLFIVIGLFMLSINIYAADKSEIKGACYVSHMVQDEDFLERSMNCTIQKKKSPYGIQVYLNFLDPKKEFTHAKILESYKDCFTQTGILDKSCPQIELYNGKKVVTSVFSDMTVYANNNGETENSTHEFTAKTPNISTCSRYISRFESITICYKTNAKNKNDVANGFHK